MNTKVLAASFTSIDDVMKLAGIHHVTLPAYLLERLESLPASTTKPKSLFEEDSHEIPLVSAMYLYRKETFMKAIERGYYRLSQVGSICYTSSRRRFCKSNTIVEPWQTKKDVS